jgi:hypothetical protein
LPRYPALSPSKISSILAMSTLQLSISEIAKRNKCSVSAVSKVRKQHKHLTAKENLPNLVEPEFTDRDYKAEVRPLAYDALLRSLRDTKDIHKAAGTAVAALKGIGEFTEAQLQVGVVISLDGSRIGARYATNSKAITTTTTQEIDSTAPIALIAEEIKPKT